MTVKVLELRTKMCSTYLVQRLCKGREGKFDNPFNFGGGYKNGGCSDDFMDVIRPIFTFDYMGAAEYEFGAVPAALQFLVNEARKDGLEGGVVACGEENHPVYFIAPRSYIPEVAKRIKDMYAEKLRVRAPVMLRRFFKGSITSRREGVPEEADQKVRGWLELDNGFMFFADKGMWLQCCELFGLTSK